MGKEYTVLGFDEYAENIIFHYNGGHVFVKHTLPKNKLVAYLDISPEIINKKFRDKILEEARKKGRQKYCYTFDGENYQKLRWIEERKKNPIYGFEYTGLNYDYKIRRLVSLEEFASLPEKHENKPCEILKFTSG